MFTEQFELSYNSEMMRGAATAIHELGHDLILMPMMSVLSDSQSIQNYLKFMMDFSRRLNIDGYILPIGTLSSRYGKSEELTAYLRQHFSSHKILCLEEKVPGLPSIVKDNDAGMKQLINHLISYHHYHHYGIIAGEKTSHGSKQRLAICKQALTEHHIDYHVTHGSFRGYSEAVIEAFLNQYPQTDVLVCLNDQLAFCAYRVIEDRGLIVGKDIGVTGFDDVPQAALIDPPLSTVKSDAFELGYRAGYEIINLIEGKPQQVHQVSSAFIDRRSCGDTAMPEIVKLQQLIVDKPFPVEKITQYFFRVGGSFTKAPFYREVSKLVATTEKLFNNQSTKSNVFLLRRIMKMAEKEEYCVEVFYDRFMNYCQCLLEKASHREALLQGMLEYKDFFTNYFYTKYFEEQKKNLQKQGKIFAMGTQTSMNEMNSNEAFYHIFQSVNDLGYHFMRLYLLDQPVRFDIVPSKGEIYLKGELCNGKIKIYNEYLDERKTILSSTEQRQPHTYVLAALHEKDRFSGFMMIEAEMAQMEELYFITQQISLSVKYLKMFKMENEMIELLNGNNVVLSHQAKYDELTGLLNRRGFYDQVKAIVNIHAGEHAILYYMDLDRLKYINDHYGHSHGDQALKKASEILQSCFRSDDILARMGGDEFVAFALSTDNQDHLSMRLEEAFDAYNREKQVPYPVNLSVGYSALICHEGMPLDDYLRAADTMLYEHKRLRKVNRK